MQKRTFKESVVQQISGSRDFSYGSVMMTVMTATQFRQRI